MGKWDNLLFRIRIKIRNATTPKQFLDKKTPIIINNFNRLACLKIQINWLLKSGFSNIYIIDNCSTYRPLLEYYKTIPHVVFLLDKNIGHEALWKTVIFQFFKANYYVYTDPDVIPAASCPADAINYFYDLLRKYSFVDKVGFGLTLEEIPDHYPLKEKVINWEKQFWQNEIEHNVFEAPIDTTFALYRPNTKGGAEVKSIRTGKPYLAHHLGWYLNPLEMNAEDIYYAENAGRSSSWTSELLDKKGILNINDQAFIGDNNPGI